MINTPGKTSTMNTIQNTKTQGFIAAPLTGFNEDGSVNTEIVSAYAKMLKSGGVAGVFVNGTTGEGISLTLEERLSLAEAWIAQKSDTFKVFIHLGYADQATSFKIARHAVEKGADAVGEIGPCSNQPDTIERLIEYIMPTAEAASSLPYYYYHMPSINNVAFPMLDFLEKVDGKIPNLTGIKYTHEDLDDYERCLQFKDGRYDILFGRDEILIDGLQRGANGAVGSTYNFMTPLYSKLEKAFKKGDTNEAKRLQALSVSAIDVLVKSGSFFSASKTVLGEFGLDLGGVRIPNADLTADEKKKLINDLQKTGAFEFLNASKA